jgi:hypothetical protein
MKFKDFLKEDVTEQDIKEFEKFTKDFHVQTVIDWISYETDPKFSDRKDINEIIHDPELMSKVTNLQIFPGRIREFYWPKCLKDFSGAILLNSEHPEDPGMIVKSFDDFPTSSHRIGFSRVVFEGTRGIERLTQLKDIYFRVFCQFNNCGLLWLLKSKAKQIDLFVNRDESFSAAFKIVKKHFDGDRDIVECMDELIEAGLKEYAKL